MTRLAFFVALLLTTFAMEAEALDEFELAYPETSTASAPSKYSSAPELRRNAVSMELLGRGLLYSFNYDHLIRDDIAVGGGWSAYSISSGGSSAKAFVVPMYANYYFTQGEHRFFASAGANLIFASGKIEGGSQISGSGLAGVLGGGYELRSDSGFLFRAAPYLFVGKATGAWVGFSLGYTI